MKRIFISAGHSDADPGAVANGRTEAAIVLEFRDLVAEKLEKAGVAFSRDSNANGRNMPLRDAVKMIGAGDLAVEFHLNAAASSSASGVETLSAAKDYVFCGELCAAISKFLGIKNRGAKPENSGQHSRLAFVQAGGIIVELFFLTNRNDLAAYDAAKNDLADVVAGLLITGAK